MREEVSALMDGELSDVNSKRVFDGLKRDGELREAWSDYHLIGDALRRQLGLRTGLAAQVMERLESEPTVIAPVVTLSPSRRPMQILLPLAASVAGVAVVAWLALGINQEQGGAMLSASAPVVQSVTVTNQQVSAPQSVQPAVQAVVPVSVPLPSSAIKEYLIAHQGYSPSNSIQGMAPYIRTVTEERQAARQ